MDEGHKFVFFFASYKQRWLHYARSQDSFLENALRLRNSSNWNHPILNSSLVCRPQGIFDKRTSILLSFTFAEPQVSQARFTRTSSLWSCFAKGFVWWKRAIRYRSWAIFWVCRNIRENWIREPRVAVLTVTSPQGSPRGVNNYSESFIVINECLNQLQFSLVTVVKRRKNPPGKTLKNY